MDEGYTFDVYTNIVDLPFGNFNLKLFITLCTTRIMTEYSSVFCFIVGGSIDYEPGYLSQ